ncbi:hypothetical protein B0H11DRAFT_2229645 [Mycena galericulata]|nr:hypothetical protein B0H11DRAFT_2229645 [Mycena galericulata]
MNQPTNSVSSSERVPAYAPPTSTHGSAPITYTPYVYKPSKRRDLRGEYLAELYKNHDERVKNVWADAVEKCREAAMREQDAERSRERVANMLAFWERQAQEDVEQQGS